MELSVLSLVILLGALSQLTLGDVRGPPKIESKSVERYIKTFVGSTVRLRCPVVAYPPALTMWKKDGGSINSIWERFKVKKSGLRIEDVVQGDSGIYVCIATNGFGTAKLNITLSVVVEPSPAPSESSVVTSQPSENDDRQGVPPVFSKPEKMAKKTYTIPMRGVVRLRCRATGKPKPHIIWKKDGRTMSYKELGLDDLSKKPWVLELINVQEEDSGEYTCIVSNKYGRINATYVLQVIGPVTNKPILESEHPVNTTVEYGGTTSFQCRVKSDLKPRIQWLKRVEPHNAHLYQNTSIEMYGHKYVVIPTGEALSRADGIYVNKLVIPHATEKDAGMYICMGANRNGYSFKSAFLEVLEDPNKRVLAADNKPSKSKGVMSTQLKLVLIVALPLTSALLFVILVLACTYNINQRNPRGSSYPRGHQSSQKDYKTDYKQNISSYHHNFTRTSGSNPYFDPPPSESEHSALTCSHSNLPSDGYKTSSDKVFGRYIDMPFNPPSLYSDTTLNSHRSLSAGRVLNLSNQHHLATC